ncbi:asparagine synthase (glutamine-hydrolyzing) [Taibaiella lutea]|uniref:asparagine synthase (glutamine-hydrolyzing) n=1 Tax=Taibaiella lutea TaxID=2608001 RepID=A0A5M6CF14_9BACT|nr:asparagine synthase (glutamine-hydrolyzing) [Taibaiella lutea]KAA5533764.1 asparagine synthase (glutamine-hydrolyzing) [Taibaiella lutea]
MCGIAGILNINRQPVSHQEIILMTNALAHRGPDGEGTYIDEYMALGHRRLAILDTSPKGAQPMASKNGEWVIIFNGCIYNYLELKLELRNKGHEFISTSDTEVLAEGISEYGMDFMHRLDGMFAVAAWHKPSQTLWLSRDRFGVKPLYYHFKNGTLLFASEIKGIIAHPKYQVQLNYSALNEYFTFQNMFSFNTLFDGVKMLPAANTVKINLETTDIKHQSWWNYDFTQPDDSLTFEDAKEETMRLFKKAVAKQMVADVPVGSYLSGGMDSGSIASVASQHVPRLYTFTCGFDMSTVTGVEANYDERRDAELMASYFKTEHYEQVINAGDLRWSLPKLVWHLEDLRVGMSYPNYYISGLASKFVKVCLQGTGGDELFGGYPWRYYRVFQSLNQKDFFDQYYGFWQRLVPDEQRKELFTDVIAGKVDVGEPRRIFEKVFTFNSNLNYDTPEQHINNSLYFEIKTFLSGLLLVGDKLSMAHGLEERFPFLDNELVNFAQKIPIRHKLGNLENMKRMDENKAGNKVNAYREFDDGKNVLRKAMGNFLPEQIINRKKQGFSAPDESWYRGENADYVKELLLNKKTVSSEFINPKYMEKIINEHTNQRINHRLLIWSFMNFEWWCRIFLNNESV